MGPIKVILVFVIIPWQPGFTFMLGSYAQLQYLGYGGFNEH
jgi:hypothetical protein